MPIGLFFVLVVVLVLVIEKIELVKPVAKRIEDEDEDEKMRKGRGDLKAGSLNLFLVPIY